MPDIAKTMLAKCSACGSTNVTIEKVKTKYNIKYGLAGLCIVHVAGLVIPYIGIFTAAGLLLGFLGGEKTVYVCQHCGRKWSR